MRTGTLLAVRDWQFSRLNPHRGDFVWGNARADISITIGAQTMCLFTDSWSGTKSLAGGENNNKVTWCWSIGPIVPRLATVGQGPASSVIAALSLKEMKRAWLQGRCVTENGGCQCPRGCQIRSSWEAVSAHSYLGSWVDTRWELAGRGQAGHKSGLFLSAGACSAGPLQPWMPLRAGRVQIGSLVWRLRDWLRK